MCWRTRLWWCHKSGAAESRQKFLKLQKEPFSSMGLSFFYSFHSPNMSLLIARLCPGLCRLSTPLRSIQQGEVVTAGKPNNLLQVGQRSLQVGYEIRALMRKDSFSEAAGLSMDWPIMELLGGGLYAWGGEGAVCSLCKNLCWRQTMSEQNRQFWFNIYNCFILTVC